MYTGEDDVPDEITLQKEFRKKSPYALDIKVKVYHNEDVGFFGQYIKVCHIIQAYCKDAADKKAAMGQAIDECIDKGLLVEYLTKHRGEAMNYWEKLNDQELLWNKEMESMQEEINALSNEKDELVEKNSTLTAANNTLTEANKKAKDMIDNAIARYLARCHSQHMTRKEAMIDLKDIYGLEDDAAESYMAKHWDKP